MLFRSPEEWTGEATILRVVCREGRPCAVQIDGEHGKAWVSFPIKEYADLAREAIDTQARMEIARVGNALTIMRWLNKVEPRPEEVPF